LNFNHIFSNIDIKAIIPVAIGRGRLQQDIICIIQIDTDTTHSAFTGILKSVLIRIKPNTIAKNIFGLYKRFFANLTITVLRDFRFGKLTITNDKPGAAGIPYGQYRTDATIDGGDPWITPADGATISLKFLTTEVGGSVNPPAAGNASLVVGGVAAPVILSLTIASATNAVITWSAASNRTYRVQYASNLAATWSNLVPDVTATNNTASAVDSFGGQAQQFYRIQLVQ